MVMVQAHASSGSEESDIFHNAAMAVFQNASGGANNNFNAGTSGQTNEFFVPEIFSKKIQNFFRKSSVFIIDDQRIPKEKKYEQLLADIKSIGWVGDLFTIEFGCRGIVPPHTSLHQTG